jgi:FMN-dependent NADH-azoreductase
MDWDMHLNNKAGIMQIVVFDGSPYGRRGNTAIVAAPFLDGMREAGGEIEIINATKVRVGPCRGDLHCWFKEQHVCIQHDDMDVILPKVRDADIVVLSTPVYCDGVPGHVKLIMDRLVVMGNPFLELREDHTRHPVPPNEKPKKLFIVASCGLWEKDNFDPMIMHLKAFCRNTGFTFGGAIVRPHAFAIKNNRVNDILRAAKAAGREIVENGTISPELQDTVSREILSREEYMSLINRTAAKYLG